MASKTSETTNIIRRVEDSLQRDLIISTSFENIKSGTVNQNKRVIITFVYFILSIDMLKSIVESFNSEKYFLRYFSSHESRFTSQALSLFYSTCFCYSILLFYLEGKGGFIPMVNLTNMFEKLEDSTQIKQFTRLLQIMPFISIFCFLCITLPVTAVTGYLFYESFASHKVFLLIVRAISLQYCSQIFFHINVINLNLNSYFRMRINSFDSFVDSKIMSPSRHLENLRNKSCEKLMDFGRTRTQTIVMTNFALLQLKDILDENKDLVSKELCIINKIGITAGVILLMCESNPFILFVIIMMLAISFTNGFTRKIGQKQHILNSCQVILQHKQRTNNFIEKKRWSKKFKIKELPEILSQDWSVLKTKLGILRMIHRVIGYNNMSSRYYLCKVIIITLLFLNLKHH